MSMERPEDLTRRQMLRESIKAAVGAAATTTLLGADLRSAESREEARKQPFGLNTVPTRHEGYARWWQNTLRGMAADTKEMAACDSGTCTPAAEKMKRIIQELRGYKGWEQAQRLNTKFNTTLKRQESAKYIYEPINGWPSPLRTLESDNDCKGYTVAKYFALSALSVPSADRKIVFVDGPLQDTWNPATKRIEKLPVLHAIVLARIGEEWKVLDSMFARQHDLVSDSDYFKAKRAHWWPTLSFDDSGVREFVRPIRSSAR